MLCFPRNSLLVIAACWLLSILTGLVPLMGWHHPLPPSRECLFSSVISNTYMVYFNFMMCMLVPLLVMLIMYGRIFLEVRHQIRKVAEGEVNISAQRRHRIIVRKEMRTATSLFIILFFFILCWLPLHVLNTIMLLCPKCCIPTQLILATIILSHANSAINPVIYVFRMRSFRDALKSTLLCIRASQFRCYPPKSTKSLSSSGRNVPDVLIPGKLLVEFFLIFWIA
uniref:G-protein coupled receptors family 1 profile domain-containing protein n=1 Tax=Laticauda laticaudata TaxID=8630 RepID=A0A8C5SGZ8_LATLA